MTRVACLLAIDTQLHLRSADGLPEIDIQSFQSYLGAGRRTGVRGPEGNVSFVDTVSYLRGKHAFKFGFDFVDVIYDNNAYNRANGRIQFRLWKISSRASPWVLPQGLFPFS